MKKNLQNLLLMLVALMGLQATAAIPNNYYNSALGKSDQNLMVALHKIIKGHTKRSYGQLWSDFKTTDCNGTTIIDRYSDSQFTYSEDQCGSYSGVGDCYNREHSIPNSWWGGLDTDTAYTDLHHLIPTDGWVNSKRGNHPLGDCARGTVYGTGKLGACTHSGYTGTVFEVADEYKGDFARMYFYFATRYMMRMSTYTQSAENVVFTDASYLGLTSWAISQLLEWHRNDPVSELETKRNDAVYGIQRNRNPFVDHPELVEYLWGDKTGEAWTGNASTTPVLTTPANGSTINVGTNTGNGVSKVITVKGAYLTKAVSVSVNGTGFAVTPTTLTAAAVNAGTTITVTYNGSATNATGRLTITSTEVTSNVNLTATYNPGGSGGEIETIETWEGCTGYGSYSTTFIQGHAFAWNTNNVGIWSDDTNCNDELSCRFGRNADSYIEMAEDVTDGASKITFYAAKWNSNEATPTLQVLYSTDAGNTWTAVGSCSPSATWQQFMFNLNVRGQVRFKIAQTAGARLNVDDIAITSNNEVPVINPVINISQVDVIEAVQDGESSIVQCTVSAIENGEDISLTVEGNFEFSLDRSNWATMLTLDPTGEVIYVRLKNTASVGEYEGLIEAKTSRTSAYADLVGIVSPKPVISGDVNKDGQVSISDVTTLIDYLLGSEVNPFDEVAADVNQSGEISIADVTALIDILLSSPSKAPMKWIAVPETGGIMIDNPAGEVLEVYDLDAECVATMTSPGRETVELKAGIYVVTSDDTSLKVVVK